MPFDSQTQIRAARWLSLIAVSIPATVSAHHSFAMYDSTKLVDIVGTVKEFQWTNPHVILWVTQDPKPGAEAELWTIELPTSTGNLSRMNWSKRSLAPGDRVKVEINPLRDGQHGGSFKKATLEASGKVLTASPPAATPGAGPAASVATAPSAYGPAPATPDVGSTAKPAASSSDSQTSTAPGARHAKSEHGCACVAAGTNTGSASAGAWLLLIPLWFARRRPANARQR